MATECGRKEQVTWEVAKVQGPYQESNPEPSSCESVPQPTTPLASPNKYSGKSRRMRGAGNVAHVGKAEGKRPPGRPRRRLEDNIKVCLPPVRRGFVN